MKLSLLFPLVFLRKKKRKNVRKSEGKRNRERVWMKCKSSSKNFDVPPILEPNLSLGSEMLNRVLRNLRVWRNLNQSIYTFDCTKIWAQKAFSLKKTGGSTCATLWVIFLAQMYASQLEDISTWFDSIRIDSVWNSVWIWHHLFSAQIWFIYIHEQFRSAF
jgi:hypothetical protein